VPFIGMIDRPSGIQRRRYKFRDRFMHRKPVVQRLPEQKTTNSDGHNVSFIDRLLTLFLFQLR
jgi:hypothetical protein